MMPLGMLSSGRMEIDLQQLPIPESWDIPCPGCGYSLCGLPAHRCPECGLDLVMEDIIKPWHRLRDPHFTGLELPFPDFGLACGACESPLAGAERHACPTCGDAFDPLARLPEKDWFAAESWMIHDMPQPLLEMILVAEYIPHTFREFRSPFGFESLEMVASREFFFDFLAVVRRERIQMADNRDAARTGQWRCGGCDEENPPNFDVCWNCEVPKAALKR